MNDAAPNFSRTPTARRKLRWVGPWIYDVLLVYILFAGAFFRFIGIQWGDNQYLHPDERFLVWVGADIQPIGTTSAALGVPPNSTINPWRASFGSALPDCQSWGGYFDASCSPLNPNNRGHSFYVYGTLPMFLTRYMVQWIYGHSGFSEMTNVGRVLSALVDLLSVVLVYSIGSRIFSKPVGLLAAAFMAFTVLNIQQSHFFTMDTFTNFFTLLAVYFAVRVSLVLRTARSLPPGDQVNHGSPTAGEEERPEPPSFSDRMIEIIKHPYFGLSLAFGVALGCAVASKLNAAPVALVLPVAFGLVIWRKPASERSRWLGKAAVYLGIAAFTSLLVFRIFQPYAFLGPGFFGLRPNPQWIANIKELRNQSTGDIDFPPSLQWARRPVWFSAQNMIEWGLGIPLGILAGLGFLWAGWRMLKGDWQRHLVLWLWGGFYFVWQSLQFNPTMRYQMPTYPILVIYAGWALVELWNSRKKKNEAGERQESMPHSLKILGVGFVSILVGSMVLIATIGWALAFSLIYSRPITRVAASEWIYQNIPGPVNLHIQTPDGQYSQPLSIPYDYKIRPGEPYHTTFTANASGSLDEVYLAHAADTQATQPVQLNVSFSDSPGDGQPLLDTTITVSPDVAGAGTQGYPLKFVAPVSVNTNQAYYLTLSLPEGDQTLNACGTVGITLHTSTELIVQTIPEPGQCLIKPGVPYTIGIMPQASGQMEEITFSQLVNQTPVPAMETLALTVGPADNLGIIATSSLTANLAPGADGLGAGYTMTLTPSINLEKGKSYNLSLVLESVGGVVSIQGSAVANEGDWDDGLPLRVNGYDGFGGIYTPGLNFNMYTDDNTDKLEHFIDVYNQSEYILISSNRQWGSLPRLPERFPLTSLHYRHLLGCPDGRTISWCYSVAQPGMFQGDLGFELVAVFQSNPSIGSININDQFAEEAFTVYDHPKVLVFRKAAAYNAEHARQILNRTNFSEIVRVTPKKAAYHPANLQLPEERTSQQASGGTWSQLFNPASWQNRFRPLGVIVWYLSVALLGLMIYPLLRIALPGLPDHGYPLARTAGMLVLGYLTWLAGSVNIPFSRLTISIVILAMAAAGAYLAYRQRDELRQEWRSRRNYFLIVEGLVLVFFLVFLFIRLGNPDLWHPWKGGEKPMDFSYFNAVLKSTTFPPYDPWYAGGSLNYYYWGYVFVGVLVKWLGILPAIAYNLIIPTLFSMVAMGAFSVGYNLSHPRSTEAETQNPDLENQPSPAAQRRPYLVGLAAALGMAVLGNLGTLRMIIRGWEQLGVPGGLTDTTGFFTRLIGLPVGLYHAVFQGATMPYSIGDWYWLPSRAIPAPGDVEPITEFPMFTFLYADLHAHMIAMAIILLAITWALAVLMGKARWKNASVGILSIFLGGLAIGALYPTNLSDIYTFLPIGMAALGFALYRYADISHISWLPNLSPVVKRLALAGGGMILLAVVSYSLFIPYREWYAQGYSSVIPWTGTHTPFWSYLTHWGLFLFVIISWMVWETREWMASTPLASLRKLEKYSGLIILAAILLFMACLFISIRIPGIENISILNKLPIGRGAYLVWFILPLAAWAGVLLLRPGMPDTKRLVLLWVGTGLLITLMVEMVVVRGDIGRMNTVFKFYLHAWALFAVSSAAALGWLLEPVRRWLPGWRISWRVAFSFLVFSAALFTLYGSMAKIKDRWVTTAPHTLDGMAYMPYASYYESYPTNIDATAPDPGGVTMDLSQDYRAIRWMQENVQGSPVIVEANSRNLYRWYSRFTIYTGLPGVVGWEWHEQQQRTLNSPEWVTKRVLDIEGFYTTTDLAAARQFLNLYGVKYIIVGQLEQVAYPGPGLDKFAANNGILWNEVYRDENTVIYKVNQ